MAFMASIKKRVKEAMCCFADTLHHLAFYKSSQADLSDSKHEKTASHEDARANYVSSIATNLK